MRAALERLNAGRMGHPALPPEAITAALDELTRDRSAMSLEAANREVYRLLKEGIPVSVMDTESTPHPGPLPGRGGEVGGAHGVSRPSALESERAVEGGSPSLAELNASN